MRSYAEHLRSQLSYIRRSADLFDQGHVDEGIRIAQSLRVIFHRTSKSTSILKHMGVDSINLLSTVEPYVPMPGALYSEFHGMLSLRFDGKSFSYTALLNKAGFGDYIPFEEWWNQTIFQFGDIASTRKTTILGASNKDGGAHVDPKIDEEYRALLEQFWSPVDENLETLPGTEDMTGAHLYALRQMAYEVLNSPDLMELTNGQCFNSV